MLYHMFSLTSPFTPTGDQPKAIESLTKGLELGMPKQTLENWVRLHEKGQLQGASDKPVSPEQMELARLRAQLARVTMERDILKKATAYFAKESL